MLKSIALALLLSHLCLANVLQSKSITIENLCDNLLLSLQLLNINLLVKLINRENCREYELLGEAVLQIADKAGNYCYRDVAAILCNTRYIPYEANFNCEHIHKKFIKLVTNCANNDVDVATERNCSNLDKEGMTITDVLEFCRSNFVILKGEQNPVAFSHVELDYCVRIASTFNTCQNLANKTAYQRFCLDGGFQSYCSYYAQEVRDNTYSHICRNVVLPFVFGMLLDRPSSVVPSLCNNIDAQIDSILLKKRDALMSKAQSYLDTVDSQLALDTWCQEMSTKTARMGSMLGYVITYFSLCYRQMFSIFNTPYNVDPFIKTEWSKSLGIAKELLTSSQDLPTSVSDISIFITRFDSVLRTETKLQELVIQFKQLYSLIRSGSHYSNMATSYFSPVAKNILDDTKSTIDRIQIVLPQRVAIVSNFLNSKHISTSEMEKASRNHENANRLKFIASLHEAQLGALRKQLLKTKETSFSHALKTQ